MLNRLSTKEPKEGYMDSYKIITNTTADLPAEYIRENDLGLIYFNYIMDGISYGKDKELDWKEFYRLMREEGKMPTTSQVNPQQYREYFTEFLKENKNLLYLSFSSGLSGSCQNAVLAAEELMEENGECRIIVVDSKCASMGEGLFVHKALQMQREGKSMKETADLLRALVPHLLMSWYEARRYTVFSKSTSPISVAPFTRIKALYGISDNNTPCSAYAGET